MSNRHPQKDMLIVTALAKYGYDIATEDMKRSDEALNLAMEIAEEHGLCLNDALKQLD